MLNMNSPIVQNLIQPGFNPYMNNGYTPQPMMQQPMYQNYNPYLVNNQNQYALNNNLDNWEITYDPMPKVIINEARGIGVNQQPVNQGQTYYNPGVIQGTYNSQLFNGYMNPMLMMNQMEAERIRQREDAIHQGKIWKALLQGQVNDDFDMDSTIQRIESLYYNEPVKEELSMKDRIIVDKNKQVAQVHARTKYCMENNIPIITPIVMMGNAIANYYNNITSVIGDMDNCDMVDYFRRVYPELKHQQLEYEVERNHKNLKNRYNSSEFNKLLDKVTEDKPDSYYYKLMETFADGGVKLETSNGLVVTADEMEVKLPQRLLKNKQDLYYEQRKKFYDAIFRKEG